MADDRLTPKDLQLLIEAGDITQENLPALYKNDRQAWAVAAKMMEQSGKGMDISASPLAPPFLVKGAAALLPKSLPSLPSIGSGSLGTIAAQMGINWVGDKMGLPWWAQGAISSQVGRMGRGQSAPKSAPTSSPAKPFVPTGGQYGQSTPKTPPSKPSGGSSSPPNFERHGNLTRPGPDAPKGGGGPSGVNRDTDLPTNPLDRSRAPVDRRRNTDPLRDTPLYRQMKEGIKDPSAVKEFRSGIDRRSPNVERQKFNRLDPDKFDEVDKRRTLFGGVSANKGDSYTPPSDRKPLTKADIEQMIKNILKLSGQD